ncbi:YozE family protein [Virgibacillus sp. NKC19-16]|uniref:YozE family protein n=1 Tax=Virgibacillus salidurans TaxID=2831673 RepID=UPI001F1DDCED|nr:YozE family protein [Virgibacillus sp. NKC19-16]UJL48247.1 YozE family protein [Virgibacillus sp. NKC19-16]
MRSFYQFLMTFRGKKPPDDQSRLADWVFFDHDFPKHSSDYDEISNYLEWNSPFPAALAVFDELWDKYKLKEDN